MLTQIFYPNYYCNKWHKIKISSTENMNKTVPFILKPKQKDKLNGLKAKVLDYI